MEVTSDEDSRERVVSIIRKVIEFKLEWDGAVDFVTYKLHLEKELQEKLVESPDFLPQQIASMRKKNLEVSI